MTICLLSHRHFALAPAYGSYRVKSISGLLNLLFTSAHRSHLLCGMSIRKIQDVKPNPRFAFLVIVQLSFRLLLLGATTKKQKLHLSKRNFPLLCVAGSIWLQASREWFPQLRFCCERRHSTKGIKQNHLRAEGFCYLSMAGSTKDISEWKVSDRPSMHRLNWQHILGRRFLSSFYQKRVIEKYIYIDGFYYRSLRGANQNWKSKHLNSGS